MFLAKDHLVKALRGREPWNSTQVVGCVGRADVKVQLIFSYRSFTQVVGEEIYLTSEKDNVILGIFSYV